MQAIAPQGAWGIRPELLSVQEVLPAHLSFDVVMLCRAAPHPDPTAWDWKNEFTYRHRCSVILVLSLASLACT